MTTPHPRLSLRSAAIPILAVALGIPVAAQGSVTLYENATLGGRSAAVTLSSWGRNTPWPLAAYAFDDTTTSLTWSLATDVAVTFYENSDGSGTQWNLTRSSIRSGLSLNIGATYNDTWSAFSWQLDDPSVGGTVTLHENSGFGGIAKRLPLSSYTEGALHRLSGFDNKATGITWSLQPNVIVTFYENADGTGREYTLMHDQPSGSISAVPSDYNDKFSSFRWQHIDPTQGWVRMYTDGAFAGYHLTRYVSDTGLVAIPLGPLGHNDQVDSVRWDLPIGTTMLLFDQTNLQGRSYSLTGSGSRDFRSSSIWHDRISVVELRSGDLAADLSDRNRPYDRNTYLMARDAHRHPGKWQYVWQLYDERELLDYGVRALHFEVGLHNGQFYTLYVDWNTTLGELWPGETPKLLYTTMLDIQVWLNQHPREVITLVFDNHAGTAMGDYLLDHTPITGMVHLHQRGSWPTLNELIAANERCVVFERDAPQGGRLPELHDYVSELDYAQGPGVFVPSTGSLEFDEMHRSLFLMHSRLCLPCTNFATLNSTNQSTAQYCNYVAANWIGDPTNPYGEDSAVFTRVANQGWPVVDTRAGFSKFAPLSCGARDLSATSRPVLGTNLALQIDKPATTTAAQEVLAVGTSDSLSASNLPLPFLLPSTFGNQCTLRVSPDVILPIGSGSYPMLTSVGIPLSLVLQGVDVYFQGIGLTATGRLTLSDGGRARLGMQ